MAGSVNKCIIVGNLGQDPEVKSFQNGGRVGFIEVKCEGNYQQASQKECQRWLTEFGHRYAVCRSIDDVTETLKEWNWI